MDTAMDPRQQDVVGFVEAHLPGAPARVLEVGCGNGWLCHHLASVGYEAQGIDPQAPEDPLLLPIALQDFDQHASFDAVVANLSLYHIKNLGQAIDKLAVVLAAGGVLVVVEFAWERFDDRTARWCLDRLPSQLDEDNWLHKRLIVLRGRLDRGERLRARELFRDWAAGEGLHSSVEMREALRSRFPEDFFEWSPYLYPDLEGVTSDEERSAIDQGEIQPMGFRVVGSVRA
jgi:SAM-dependent methyltransferase